MRRQLDQFPPDVRREALALVSAADRAARIHRYTP
jgi:hypothetical protein